MVNQKYSIMMQWEVQLCTDSVIEEGSVLMFRQMRILTMLLALANERRHLRVDRKSVFLGPQFDIWPIICYLKRK